jgi:SpoVK/Ycf46/Vps4 family AAA+-type ATPase
MNSPRPQFHPINDAPKFMDVSEVNESGLILNRSTMRDLEANVFMLIEQTEACRKNGIGLKYGLLLAGKYGTGKTLTARVMASKAVRNGWTYIYLKTGTRIATALKLAEHYAPAVVFTEDIDDIVCGERNQHLNEILNVMDGVDTKDKPIITIVTTNHPEKINKACLRPGRIDKVIRYHEPDAETAARFVQMYAKDDDDKSLLSDDVDLVKVGEAMAGFVPAFIAESVQMAKRFAMCRNHADIGTGVTTDDLLDAAAQAKDQIAMMNRNDDATYEEKSHAALRHIGAVICDDYCMLPNFVKNGS